MWVRVGLEMLYALWAQWPETGENELEALLESSTVSRFEVYNV